MIYAAFLFLAYNDNLIQTNLNGYKKGYSENFYFTVTFFC
jgi:hypothetical protein